MKKGTSKTLKSFHQSDIKKAKAFDLVLFEEGKPTVNADSYNFLRDIVKEKKIPLQQGIITQKKDSGQYNWWDKGHFQVPSQKGIYGGLKNWKKYVYPKTSHYKTE